MTEPYELGKVPKGLRRRANVIATVAIVAVAVALLMLVLLVEGVRPEPSTWAVLGAVAIVVVGGLVLAQRTISDDDRATIGRSQLRVLEPLPAVPDDQEVLDADASDIDLTQEPSVRVVLHPGPVNRRRLAGRPDALVVVADAEALDVPGWIVEGRSRMIDRADRVLVPWAAIERFRVRADSDGPDVYDISARADAPPPRRWRIRRNEIADEIELLDHVRRIGRITIELEDSIRS